MRVLVPSKIKQNLEKIEKVWIEYDNATQPDLPFVSFSVSKLHFEKMDFIEVIDEAWKNCSFVRYRIAYPDGTEETLDFEDKETAKYQRLNALGVYLEGKKVKVGSFFKQCDASKDIAKNNLFSFNTIKDIPAYVINLDADYPRYLRVRQELTELGFSNINRWEATDTREDGGAASLKRYGINSLAEFNSNGAVGCAVSHLNLYEDFLKSDEQFRLVFEDDAVPHSKFHELIDTVDNLSMDSFDVLFLGGWFWGFGEKDAIKDVCEAVKIAGESCILRNPTSFETHAMLISRRFAYKVIDNYRRWVPVGNLGIDTYITQSKYFDTCLLTFEPFDSDNVDKLQLRNMNNCGLFFQANIYGSHIQKKSVQGVKEISRYESGGDWFSVLPEETYQFDRFCVYGDSELLKETLMTEVGILRLDGGIVSPYGVVGNKEERWVLDLSWFGSSKNRPKDTWKSIFTQKKNNYFSTDNLTAKKGEALNLFAVWSHFNPGHLQMDCLGMLSLFLDAQIKDIHEFDWLCLPRTQARIKQDLLKLLDIDPAKIVELGDGEAYQFESLYAPSLYGNPCMYRRGAFSNIRKLFKTRESRGAKRLLYVSREDAGRDAQNLQELEALLHDLGFQKILARQLKTYEKLFSEALVVVGAHGAGLANIMFCPEEATLIELVPDFHQQRYYMSLADSVGMDYVGLLCEYAESSSILERKNYTVNGEKSFVVNLNLLEGAINGILHKKL